MADFAPLNLAQLYQSADASVAQAMQTNLLVLQSSRMKQEFDTEDKLRSLAQSSTVTDESGNKTFNRAAFTQGAYGVDPLKAMAFEAKDIEAKKAALEIEKIKGDIAKTQEDTDLQRMKLAGDRLKHMNEASTVPYLKYKELVDGGMADAEARAKVQPLYEGAVRNLVTSGIFGKDQLAKFQMPDQFDPTKAEAGMRQVLGAKDSLAQYWDEKKFAQGERHHQDSMTIQIRGQNITLRGQDLTDERAREGLAQQGLEVKETGEGQFVIIDKKNNGAETVVDKVGKPVQGKSNLTESQGKALGFGQRAVQAHNLILGLEGGGEFGKWVSVKQGAGNTPLVGGILEGAINSTLPGGMQKYEQAQRDFVNAVLRPESGATITPQEFDNAKKQYFPQVGDTPAVIKQKQEARGREIDTLKAMAGPSGAKQFPAITAPKGADGDKAAATTFASEADADAAAKAGKIKKGDKITVGGVPGVWQ